MAHLPAIVRLPSQADVGDAMMADRPEPLHDLVRFMRRGPVVDARSSIAAHRDQLDDIWHEALRISGHDHAEAIALMIAATSLEPFDDEADDAARADDPRGYERYADRLDAVPDKAFGPARPYRGRAKVESFFRGAAFAHRLCASDSLMLKGTEIGFLDRIRKFFHIGAGERDRGHVWAWNLGIAFGLSLALKRRERLIAFLASAIHEDQMIIISIRVALDDVDVEELIVPSPDDQDDGRRIEIRCVGADHQYFVILLEMDGEDIRSEKRRASQYRFGERDPWAPAKYEPGGGSGRGGANPNDGGDRARTIIQDMQDRDFRDWSVGQLKNVSP